MRTHLLLPLLLVAPTSVGCGSLYYGGYEDSEYAEPTDEAPPEDAAEGQVVDEDQAFEAGEDVASVDVFYDALDEDGVWQQDTEYGYVFAPYADDYVPYSDGYWAETEYGQTWVATDAIGWAVCHYGRWIYRDRWLWIPDTVWGPAWVDWRLGGGWVGWAPLGIGAYSVPYYSWRFVSDDYLYARDLGSRYRRVHDVRQIYPQTHRVDRYIRGRDGRRYVAGPAHVGRSNAPPPVRVRDLPARGTGRYAGAERGRRSDAQRPGYRASRAHSERMSRAGLDPSRRTTDTRYRTPNRRYSPPSRAYNAPTRRDDRSRRASDARRQPTPGAHAPARSGRRGAPGVRYTNPRRGMSGGAARSPRAVPTYRGGGSRRGAPAAGSSNGRKPSKARSDSRRGPSRSPARVRSGGSRGHSGSHRRGR